MSSSPANVPSRNIMSTIRESSFKAGNDKFIPKDLIELPRPNVGKANTARDLVLASAPNTPSQTRSKSRFPINDHISLIPA